MAATVAGVAVERDAGRVQRLHVPLDGPDRHLEFPGELRGRQSALACRSKMIETRRLARI
jgi:hypothetical protein